MDLSTYRFDLNASLHAWIEFLRVTLTEPRGLFWWPTLAVAVLGAAFVLRPGGTRPSVAPFLRELPVDVLCFLGYTLTIVLMSPVLFWAIVGGTTLVFLAAGVPAASATPHGFWQLALVAFLAFVFSDFFLYWSHRLFHWLKPLWLLHSLHHRPPVLTPLTAFRFWPPEAAVHFLAFNFGEGLAYGIGCEFFGANMTPMRYLGLKIFLVAWYLAFSQLRHSHIPLYFPRWLSYLLVSPQMHQAHHSVDPAHHQRNFGTALAVWDGMFGTLHIPAKSDRFRFGIDVDQTRRPADNVKS